MKQHSFKKMMCKVLAFVLVFGQLSHFAPVAKADAFPSGYWPLLEEYVAVRDTTNYQGTISVCLQIEQLFLYEPSSTTRNENLYNMYDNLSRAYEALGDYENAIYYAKQQITYAQILTDAGVRDFNDVVIYGNKRLIQLDPMTEVYVLSQNLSQIPDYNQKHEPDVGAYFGRTTNGSNEPALAAESAISFYVECLKDPIAQYDYLISPYDTGTRLIQICYNMPNLGASVSQILTESANAQLIADMQYLGTLQSPILLRIGGEMNDFQPDAQEFKNAFIKIANFARQYAPNVALVFSPNDSSPWGNWDEDVMRYYPGDAYVDWVGISAYSSKVSTMDNLFYGAGDYSDPIHDLVEVVRTFGDRKPILVSESGSPYSENGVDYTAFSQSQVTKLFTYANMVFPQVKAVINFDYNPPAQVGELFSMSSNSALFSSYRTAISNNNTLLSSVQDKKTTAYVEAGTYNDSLSNLTFASFSAPVGQPNLSVTYTLDGNPVWTSSSMPYTCEISVSDLSVGTHSLTVDFYGDNGFTDSKHYSLVKNGGTSVVITESGSAVTPEIETPSEPEPEIPTQPEPEVPSEPEPDVPSQPEITVPNPDSGAVTNRPASGLADITSYVDVGLDSWYYEYVAPVVNANIMVGYDNYYLPEFNASRGMIAHALLNMSREVVSSGNGQSEFTDVSGTGYEDIVAWCASKGLMAGMGDGTFGTNNDVTREQFALVLQKYAGYLGHSMDVSDSAVTNLQSFSDSEAVSSWAENGVAWAVENGLMAGSDGKLSPGDSISRAQVATMLCTFGINFG